MGDPAHKIPPTDPHDTDAARAGQLVLEQLHALGMTDHEIAAGEPLDVSHDLG